MGERGAAAFPAGAIVHTVLAQWRTAPGAGAQADRLADLLLRGIPGVLALASGPSAGGEGLENGLEWAMTVVFDGRDALDGYLPHPDHLVVAEYLRAASAQLVVFDVVV